MQKIPENIARILANLPKTPGVYQMKNADGKVIYVGKAVNLKSRVGSYFKESTALTPAKKSMITQIADIEILLCNNEVEALVLETNLIKHLTPKYNILMKDDKNLSYIKITADIVPEIIKTRQKWSDGGRYFGPFTQGTNIGESLKSLRRIFKIRSCRMKFAKNDDTIKITDHAGRSVPCMDYYIGICPAPCLLENKNINEHHENIDKFIQFLNGKTGEIIENLKNKMAEHAKNHEFEQAQKIKEEISALSLLSERQIARDAVEGDIDIAIFTEKYHKIFVALTKIRDGKIIGVFRYQVEWSDNADTIFEQFLAREYISENNDFAEFLLLEKEITDKSLKTFLKEKRIKIEIPSIGKKREMLDFTRNQLREFAYKNEMSTLDTVTLSRANMENILQKLGYPIPKKWPIIFECYDISHTHGQFTYASRVVIKNGKTDNANYKKYKIHTLDAGDIDDFASHKEVMIRRTLEGIRENNFPHLIIIDGGKWQLSSAIAGVLEGKNKSETALEANSIFDDFPHNFPICSIAKREEEIFLPNTPESIIFAKWSAELRVLQLARDESHRFSITANRTARNKAMKKNILEELPWIGPTTRKKLLKLANSIDGIKSLSETEILTVINKKQLQTLKDHWLF